MDDRLADQDIVDATLILTVLNEEQSLPAFLDGLSRQTALPREVVVVDGGSTDRTVEILRSWRPPDGVSTRIEILRGANIASGRNAAIRFASSPKLLVTDAGVDLTERWVELMYAALSEGVDVVSGFFAPGGETDFERILATAITPQLAEIDPSRFLPSSRSIAFRKSAWQQVGGYPEEYDYCEDLVFDLRLKRAGADFLFEPQAIARWNARPDLRSFARQYYRYARGDAEAGLWWKRHAVRYATYAAGMAVVAQLKRNPLTIVPLTAGVALAYRRYFRRVLESPTLSVGRVRSLALVPVIALVGDLAKIAGYGAGLARRLRRGR